MLGPEAAVLRGISMAGRRPGGIQIHASMDAACHTLMPMVIDAAGLRVRSDELPLVVDLLRERMGRPRRSRPPPGGPGPCTAA